MPTNYFLGKGWAPVACYEDCRSEFLATSYLHPNLGLPHARPCSMCYDTPAVMNSPIAACPKRPSQIAMTPSKSYPHPNHIPPTLDCDEPGWEQGGAECGMNGIVSPLRCRRMLHVAHENAKRAPLKLDAQSGTPWYHRYSNHILFTSHSHQAAMSLERWPPS